MMRLKQVVEQLLLCMPHLQLPDSVLDLNIEKYNLPPEEKKKLMTSFHQGSGVLAKMSNGTYVVFSKDGITKASFDQIQSLPSLPQDWEKHVVRVG
jgi:hypothetical protein